MQRRVEMSRDGGIDWAFAELARLGFDRHGRPDWSGCPGRTPGAAPSCNATPCSSTTHTGAEYQPLQHLSEDQARVLIYDSALTEYAALGFEYGYSVANRDALVIWEAQFGDFVNGAQSVIDEYLSSGEAKWGQQSGVVLLLPHGHEGQGPDHTSGRIERFLQLCAEGSMTVAVPSTPANYFHLLRRHVLDGVHRPMVVFTPKSMLRNKAAVSSVADFTDGRFQSVIDDDTVRSRGRPHVLLTSGKLYYELDGYRGHIRSPTPPSSGWSSSTRCHAADSSGCFTTIPALRYQMGPGRAGKPRSVDFPGTRAAGDDPDTSWHQTDLAARDGRPVGRIGPRSRGGTGRGDRCRICPDGVRRTMTTFLNFEHAIRDPSGQGSATVSSFRPWMNERGANRSATDGTAESAPASHRHARPNIADEFADLLALMDDVKRRGMISRLAVGFYDGWRPGRDEMADLVAIELGALTIDEGIQRQRRRRRGDANVTDITPTHPGATPPVPTLENRGKSVTSSRVTAGQSQAPFLKGLAPSGSEIVDRGISDRVGRGYELRVTQGRCPSGCIYEGVVSCGSPTINRGTAFTLRSGKRWG